jgi:hypothetical protein
VKQPTGVRRKIVADAGRAVKSAEEGLPPVVSANSAEAVEKGGNDAAVVEERVRNHMKTKGRLQKNCGIREREGLDLPGPAGAKEFASN